MALLSDLNKQQKLRDLAREEGVPLEGLPARLTKRIVSPRLPSDSDIEKAQEILRQHLASNTHGKPFIRTKSRLANYTFKNSTDALKEVVEQNGSAGIAEALIHLGGNIGSVRRAERATQQNTERSAFLLTTTRNSNRDLVNLFAPRASQRSRNDALRLALEARDLEIGQILLEHGANPNSCGESFQQACRGGDAPLVCLLLRAPASKPLLNPTITVNLLEAVKSGSVETVSLLATSGADGSHGQAEALLQAIQSLQPGLVLAIVLGSLKPSQQLLDAAVDVAYRNTQAPARLKHILLETLLCAGGQGDRTAAVLVECVQNDETELVRLLVQHGTSVNFNNGQVVAVSVERGRLDFLRLLLANRSLAADNATTAFSKIPLPLERDMRYEMSTILIDAGATGAPLHEELIRAVAKKDDRFINLLLLNQASVDYRDGAALRNAVEEQQIDLVSRLISKNPTQDTLSKVFPSIRSCSTKLARLLLTKVFIQAGTRGHVVDAALRDAIRDQTDLRDKELIEFLSKGGADANFNQGESLTFSVDNGDLGIVPTLLTSLTDTSTISAQIPRAMKLHPPRLRHQMLHLLIEKLSPSTDPGLEQLHIALVDAIDETPVDVELLGLLLGKGRANVNYNKGEALGRAIKHTDISIVEYMFRPPDGFQPRTLRFETMRNALSTVIDLYPSDTQKLPKLKAVIRRGVQESTLSEALIWEIERHSVRADPGSWPSADVLGVLLDAGADVNAQSGKSVMLATEAAALPILKILLRGQPTSNIVDAAMSTTLRLTKLDDQLSCSRTLLEMGVTDQAINQALVEVSGRGDASARVTQQLLDFGGCPGYDNAASIKAATQARGSSTLRLLLEATKNAKYRDSVGQIRTGISSSLILGTFSSDFDICRLLLKYGASVDYGGSKAIKKVTQSGNLKLLQLLLSTKPSADTLGICFEVIRGLDQDRQYPILELLLQAGMTGPSVDSYLADLLRSSEISVALVSLLVKFKASVHHENDRGMRSATLIQSYEIFSIICQAATKRSSFAYCFAEGMRHTIWRSHVGLQKLSLLLDKGACGEPVDHALVAAVAAYGKESNSIPFVDLLLHHNADVDYKDGLALQLACSNGDISLISKLVKKGPSGYVKFLSLSELLNSPNLFLQPEEATVNAIHAVVQSPGEHPDLNPNQADHRSILKQSLTRRPEGARILNTLIKYGAAVEGLPSLSHDGVNGAESSSLLFWALSQSDVEISTDCISLVIEAGGLADAKSFLTGKTPLILAAERGRHDVLRKLVQSGADVSARDDTNRSPLFYASQRGDSDSVRLLMDSGAAVNDGCLHEAAGQLRLDAVKVLLDAGHHPDFPSPIEEHGGRGALGELLLRGRATEMNQHQVRETIIALINGGADVTVKESGKPLIYLAIDNEEPNLMVKSFIGAHLWKNKGIDQDYNLVTIGNYCYSPVMYVEENQRPRPPPDREGLLGILRQRAERQVYYAITGPQPPRARGMPEYMQREFEIQRLAEQRKREQEDEHQRILRHFREQEAQAQQISQQRHRLQVAQDSERARNQRDEASASVRQAMDLDDEAALRRRAIAEYDRSAELTHHRNLADQDHVALERRNRLAIGHAQNLALTEQRSLEAKARFESRMLTERNSFQQQQHNRTLAAAKAITAAAQASGTSTGHFKGFIESGELG